MTVPTWPAVLPRPARGTYQSQRGDGRLRRSDQGPPGYRRRFSSMATTVSMSIDVPRADLAVFDAFYDDITQAGTLPFWMPAPTTDGWPLLGADGAPVLTADGAPILLSAQWLCLFGAGAPVVTIRGVRFDVAFDVAVMP